MIYVTWAAILLLAVYIQKQADRIAQLEAQCDHLESAHPYDDGDQPWT